MQYKLMHNKSYLILAIATLLATHTLLADTVQHLVPVPNSNVNYLSGETPQPVDIPQFDASLGSLVAVHISVVSTMNYNSFVVNFGGPANITADYTATSNLRRSDSSLIVSGSIGAQGTAFLNNFDSVVFLGTETGTVQTTLTSPADFANFTGAGTTPLVFGKAGSVVLSDPVNLFGGTDLQLAGEITVTYEYSVVSSTQAVVLDVLQGTVNLKSKGVLPVAILSTASFSALDVDVSTLRLGDPALTGTVAPLRAAAEDVNGDGVLDVILHFSTPDMLSVGAVNAASTQLALSGATTGGTAIEGVDSIRIAPGSTKGK